MLTFHFRILQTLLECYLLNVLYYARSETSCYIYKTLKERPTKTFQKKTTFHTVFVLTFWEHY